MAITCPICSFTSHHPMDEQEGYCGHCHAFTSASCPFPPEAVRDHANTDGRCILCLHRPEEHPRHRDGIPKPSYATMLKRVDEILDTARADIQEMTE